MFPHPRALLLGLSRLVRRGRGAVCGGRAQRAVREGQAVCNGRVSRNVPCIEGFRARFLPA